jgi:hypothetical protein
MGRNILASVLAEPAKRLQQAGRSLCALGRVATRSGLSNFAVVERGISA